MNFLSVSVLSEFDVHFHAFQLRDNIIKQVFLSSPRASNKW